MTSLSCRVGRFSICGRGAATLRVARGVRLLCVHVSVDVCQKHSTVFFFFYIFYSGTLSPTNQNVGRASWRPPTWARPPCAWPRWRGGWIKDGLAYRRAVAARRRGERDRGGRGAASAGGASAAHQKPCLHQPLSSTRQQQRSAGWLLATTPLDRVSLATAVSPLASRAGIAAAAILGVAAGGGLACAAADACSFAGGAVALGAALPLGVAALAGQVS
jgi:hypothetical protein